jgi:hypothetical protein
VFITQYFLSHKNATLYTRYEFSQVLNYQQGVAYSQIADEGLEVKIYEISNSVEATKGSPSNTLVQD